MDCLLHEMGMILPNGKIDLVNLHEQFNEDKDIHFTFIHMIRKCLYPKGEGCERAFNLNSCFKTADPRVNIFSTCLSRSLYNTNHSLIYEI